MHERLGVLARGPAPLAALDGGPAGGHAASRAGGAIPGLAEAERRAAASSPLGTPRPETLGDEVVHLLRPGSAVTGEIRHVDGGQNLLA